ncbi:MAG: hemolysin family protein, partial [bacterium]
HKFLPGLGVPVFWATIIVDIIILVTAEITPKTLSLSDPTKSSLKVAKVLDIAAKILSPFVWLLTYIPSKLLNIENIFHSGEGDLITESQMVHMIDLGAREGTIESSEGERAVKVFKFADTMAEDVMTPRGDFAVLSKGDSLQDALALANLTGYSRIPVMTADGNDSIGFIAAKDLLKTDAKALSSTKVESCVRPVHFIPEIKNVLSLLEEFRSTSDQIALVVNEFGTITGLITFEDLLEEVLGEIYDEYDKDESDLRWVMGNLVIPGGYPADELSKKLNVKLPKGDYDTVAGLILLQLGRLPHTGEKVVLGGLELMVTHIVRHRITRISAKRITEPDRKQDKTPKK